MGCPDWPKCFGSWVPPTHINQLPPNYKEIYTAQRVAKNQKLARTLQKMGFSQVAGDIFAHPTQYIETDFNPVKTWIEYVNRLLGALIGVFVMLTLVFAIPIRRTVPVVFWLALGSVLLTGIQGWLGSLVVSTNLLPVMVTIHMGLALVIVAMLLYAVDLVRSQRGEEHSLHSTLPSASTNGNATLQIAVWAVLLLTFVQIVLGTQVREEVDIVAAAAGYMGRETWVSKLSGTFSLHRVFSAVLLLANVYVGYEVWQLAQVRLRRLVVAIFALIGLEIAAGWLLAAFALPAIIQPVHLTLATVLFGLQFLLLLAMHNHRKAGQMITPSGAAQRVVA